MNKEDLNCFSELMMLVSSFEEDIADSESTTVAWNKFDRFCKDVEALREADNSAAATPDTANPTGSKNDADEVLKAADTICLNCAEDTLNNEDICDACAVRKLCEQIKKSEG